MSLAGKNMLPPIGGGGSMFFPPIKESGYRVIFYAIIRERDVTISRI